MKVLKLFSVLNDKISSWSYKLSQKLTYVKRNELLWHVLNSYWDTFYLFSIFQVELWILYVILHNSVSRECGFHRRAILWNWDGAFKTIALGLITTNSTINNNNNTFLQHLLFMYTFSALFVLFPLSCFYNFQYI